MLFLIYTYLCVCTMAFPHIFPFSDSNVCLSHAGGLMRRDLFIVFVRCAIDYSTHSYWGSLVLTTGNPGSLCVGIENI